jgi:hypothetical protein
MADPAPKPTMIRVRGSRAQIEAVKKTAERAGLQLAREQDDSVSQVAQALAQITENEDLAQLEGRLTFVERQLERLAARKDESDHLLDSELAVMRARLEDTLRAFAAATQEHADTMASVERSVALIASEGERRNRSALEAMRIDLSGRIEAAGRVSESLQAQMAAEKRAFEEEAARRAGALADSIGQARRTIEARIRSATAELQDRVDTVVEEIEANHPGRAELLAEVEGRIDEWLSAPLDQLERLNADLVAAQAEASSQLNDLRAEVLDTLEVSEEKALGAALHLETIILQVRRRLVADEAEWSAVVGEAGDAVSGLRSRVEELLGRVCELEASGASERGAQAAQVENVGRRLDLHEDWARVSITEVSELSLRLAAMESRLAAVDEVRSLAEEQAGTIEFLKQRIADLEEHQAPVAPPAPLPPGGSGSVDGPDGTQYTILNG